MLNTAILDTRTHLMHTGMLFQFRSGQDYFPTLFVFLFPKHTAFILMQMNLRCCYLNSNHCLILVYYWSSYQKFLSDLEQLGMSQHDFITSSCDESLYRISTAS